MPTRGRGRITAEMYHRLPHLEVVGRCGAGLDNIDTVAAKSSGITVVHAPGRTTHAVSEHALLLMLAIARRVTMLDDAVKRGAWDIREGYEGTELRGKRLAIIGLGAIGRRIAEVGTVLGMNVAYRKPNVARHPTLPLLEFDELVSTAEVIQICVGFDSRHTRPDRRRTVHPDEARGADRQYSAGPDRRSRGAARGNHCGHRRRLRRRRVGHGTSGHQRSAARQRACGHHASRGRPDRRYIPCNLCRASCCGRRHSLGDTPDPTCVYSNE